MQTMVDKILNAIQDLNLHNQLTGIHNKHKGKLSSWIRASRSAPLFHGTRLTAAMWVHNDMSARRVSVYNHD